ncbi:MAG: glucose-6-phosphate isomerase, partial [Pseudomonadota bacterium]
LEMESNGKRVTVDGAELHDRQTSGIVWGGLGTNAQHAFFQMLHQGTAIVPCEFLLFAGGVAGADQDSDSQSDSHSQSRSRSHRLLVANAIAQADSLAYGRTRQETAAALTASGHSPQDVERLTPHCTFPGNRPSTLLIAERLTPFVLGQLLALYEHRVAVEGALLGINPFDQFGVELGKVQARDVIAALEAPDGSPAQDAGPSAHLIRRLRQMARGSED